MKISSRSVAVVGMVRSSLLSSHCIHLLLEDLALFGEDTWMRPGSSGIFLSAFFHGTSSTFTCRARFKSLSMHNLSDLIVIQCCRGSTNGGSEHSWFRGGRQFRDPNTAATQYLGLFYTSV
ncbi:unnamed protein product [Urochloa humidicola]